MRSERVVQDGFDRVFETMPSDARAQVRKRVLAAVSSDARIRRARSLAVRALATYLAASVTATGVAYASSTALPGDTLYGVKLAVEEAAIAAAPTATLRESLAERSALERAREIAALASDDADARRVDAAVGRFEQAARRVLSSPDEPATHRAEARLRKSIERVPPAAKERATRALEAAGRSSSAGKDGKKPASHKAKPPRRGQDPKPGKGTGNGKSGK